jgi:galactitol-specific phosphotransferase system IIB component
MGLSCDDLDVIVARDQVQKEFDKAMSSQDLEFQNQPKELHHRHHKVTVDNSPHLSPAHSKPHIQSNNRRTMASSGKNNNTGSDFISGVASAINFASNVVNSQQQNLSQNSNTRNASQYNFDKSNTNARGADIYNTINEIKDTAVKGRKVLNAIHDIKEGKIGNVNFGETIQSAADIVKDFSNLTGSSSSNSNRETTNASKIPDTDYNQTDNKTFYSRTPSGSSVRHMNREDAPKTNIVDATISSRSSANKRGNDHKM